MHHLKIVAAIATSLIVGGCATAADQQHRVNAAQAEADESKADARAESDQKGRVAQAEADDDKAEARAESDQKGRVAQSDADVKIADAQAKFAQIREDYRHALTFKLVEIDKKVSNLEAKQRTLGGESKTKLGASLANIHSARAQFSADYTRLESETAVTWDAAKARLDTQFNQLDDMVDDA